MVLDLMKGVVAKAGELHFRDRPKSGEAQPDRHTGNGRLGDGEVDHALRPELFPQSLRDSKDAFILPDILPQDDRCGVLAHRLAHCKV